MRYLGLQMGLLFAVTAVGMALAAETQREDQSYLPPATLRASPKAERAAPVEQHRRHAAAGPRRRHAGASHRHRESRPHYRRYAGPRLFFGLF